MSCENPFPRVTRALLSDRGCFQGGRGKVPVVVGPAMSGLTSVQSSGVHTSPECSGDYYPTGVVVKERSFRMSTAWTNHPLNPSSSVWRCTIGFWRDSWRIWRIFDVYLRTLVLFLTDIDWTFIRNKESKGGIAFGRRFWSKCYIPHDQDL